ncbi:hypothetical protein C8D94_102142 [Marinirhabdus gelatinilytica]|uniref:Uncharacterized protein n=1 Tax=Marinirhabdus gelatinilytica TaxID=1703343 RepID=A0A370QF16_9FLAO|nr:hypothetical protein C8D94_102142 [Marinirhabdus gelatinilytica]
MGFPEIIGDPIGIQGTGIVVLTNRDAQNIRCDIANTI